MTIQLARRSFFSRYKSAYDTVNKRLLLNYFQKVEENDTKIQFVQFDLNLNKGSTYNITI